MFSLVQNLDVKNTKRHECEVEDCVGVETSRKGEGKRRVKEVNVFEVL
jgi:hypothetical protein